MVVSRRPSRRGTKYSRGARAPTFFILALLNSLSRTLPATGWFRSPTVPVIKHSLFLSIQDYEVSRIFSPGKIPNPCVSQRDYTATTPGDDQPL